MGRPLERRKRKSWKRRLGGRWDLLGCRTPGYEVGVGVLALVGRASETPGRETWYKGGHGGNYCSPGGGDMLQVEGAQSFHDAAAAVAAAAAAAVAGGGGDVLGLVGGQWIGPQ
jgi:hypothetical protein